MDVREKLVEATKMKKLNRDKRTGDYYSNDRKYFIDKIVAVASGEKSRNEINDYREISIFKNGVTL